MNIILFGPPGAGKGTQADKIVKSFNLYKISTGDLLRKEIELNSSLGKQIQGIIEKGNFVSDEIINNLIIKILSDKKFFNRIIFDGYPRNLEQAERLDVLMKTNKQEISFVFSLNVDKQTIVKRILGRQTCSKCDRVFNEYFNPSNENNHPCGNKFLVKRSDDTNETIQKRFETYENKTLPILNFYKKHNLLHEINGKVEINEIFKQISGIIASIET